MHILLVSRSFPHHRPGGLEWHGQDVADGLMAAGHTVSVVTTPLPEKAALHPLKVNGEVIEAGHSSGTYDPWFIIDFMNRVRKRIRDLRPDIIHAQGFAGLLAVRYLEEFAPVVTTIHGTLWSETPLRGKASASLRSLWRFKHRHLIAPLWKSFLQGGPNLIVDSHFTVEELTRELGAPEKEAELRPIVVPLGFDLNRFVLNRDGREPRRKTWDTGRDEPLIATIGRLDAIKRPLLIAKTFARIADDFPKARLVIGGSGREQKKIFELPGMQKLIREKRAVITGALPPLRAASLLEAADVFINADHGAPAFGLSNAEALVMGTPVLAFDVGAHREVVSDPDDGILVAANDENGFAAESTSFLQKFPEAAEIRAARAKRAREHFARGLMIDALVNVYTDIVSRGR